MAIGTEDCLWTGHTGDKLYINSGSVNTIESTIHESQSLANAQGHDFDGTNTIATEETNDDIIYFSGQITTTVKASVDVGVNDGSPFGATYDANENTPWLGSVNDKHFLYSGAGVATTTTIKTSRAIGIAGTRGCSSYDGPHTMWGDETNEKLLTESGQFSSTIRSSVDVSAGTLQIRGGGWNGTNVFMGGAQGNEQLLCYSGLANDETIKDSVDVSGIDTRIRYGTSNNVDGRHPPDVGGPPTIYLVMAPYTLAMR